MVTKNISITFLLVITSTAFFTLNSSEIAVGQVPSLSNDTVTPDNSNTVSNTDDESWLNISGYWQIQDGVLFGGMGNDNETLLSNIIINPVEPLNLSSISTIFRINDLNQSVANYASIVYSFEDPQNYNHAGINIWNSSVYAIFYDIDNGTVTHDPAWPGINTNLTWTPGSIYDLSLVVSSNNNTSLDLVVNDTVYYSKALDNETGVLSGHVGLHYGRINSIEFYDFAVNTYNADNLNKIDLTNSSDSSISDTYNTSDSQTILLEDNELPEGSYMHLYDTTPYQIINGHIAAKLPCNDDNSTPVTLLVGNAPVLNPMTLEYISSLSAPADLCLYHGSLESLLLNDDPITDIVIQNNSTEEIEFPETSSIVISVSEISKL